MAKIQQVSARQILDSRGLPTVEAQVLLSDGIEGRGIVPAGASTGVNEALELRDGGQRYLGKSVQRAVENIKEHIAPMLVGRSASAQLDIDHAMIALDGTPNKEKLGANAILAVSLAIAHAAANSAHCPLYTYLHSIYETKSHMSLPVPLMNIINGGAHADNGLDIQEYMIVPGGAATYSEAVRYGVEIFYALKALLRSKGLVTAVGDEGGFAPNLTDDHAALDCIMEAIIQAGLRPGVDVCLALDVASSQFFKQEQAKYILQGGALQLSAAELSEYFAKMAKAYPIISLEDPLAEDDWQGWQHLTELLGAKLQLVGDDLFCTNTQLLQRGIEMHAANAILIKMNQIGTLTETFAALKLAQHAGYNCIISHRSGETEDCTIADLAVATHAGQIKAGSLCRSERVAKYNQLLRIEEQLGGKAKFSGFSVFKCLKH